MQELQGDQQECCKTRGNPEMSFEYIVGRNCGWYASTLADMQEQQYFFYMQVQYNLH